MDLGLDDEGFFIYGNEVLPNSRNGDSCMKSDFPTKSMALASLAMSQLAWWMRQPEYNGADQDEWCDWTTTNAKYTLHYQGLGIAKSRLCESREFLAFKTPEIRDRFLEDRRELIEQAKPLL
jgi:hypothetical protein